MLSAGEVIRLFKVRIKMEVLRELLDVISAIVTEVKLVVTQDGLDVKVVDPSHVAMLILSLKKTAFESFTGEPVEIGVDVEKLKGVLRLAKPGDIIDIAHDANKGRLVVAVGKLTRHMSVMDVAGISDPKIPNVNPPCKVVIKTEELRQGIRGSESISDHVTLTLEPDAFLMHSEGENDKVDLRVPKDSLTLLEAPEVAKSMYPLDFFSSMVKVITTAEEVTMSIGNAYPLKLDFSFANGNGDGRFLLAPRVEEA